MEARGDLLSGELNEREKTFLWFPLRECAANPLLTAYVIRLREATPQTLAKVSAEAIIALANLDVPVAAKARWWLELFSQT